MKTFEYPESVLKPDNYSYKDRHWRAPSVKEDEEILFDEPGRVFPPERGEFGGTCCRSHYFRVTKPKYGFYMLHVKHGGGEEQWELDHDSRTIEALGALSSDQRFRLLWVIMDAHHKGEALGRGETMNHWRKAAAEKRIKTRKVRDGVKVWIENPDCDEIKSGFLTCKLR